MSRKHRKTVSIVVALAFLLTLVLPMGAALAAPSATLTSTPSPLTESSLDGATLTITLSGDTFADDTAVKSNFVLNNKPVGLSVWAVQITGPRTAEITLAFDGDFDADITNFSVTIKGAELAGGSDITTDEITLYAEQELGIAVTDDGKVKEGKESEGKLIITLEGGTFVDQSALDTLSDPVTISGDVPSGVDVDSVTRVSDTKLEVKLIASNADYDVNKEVTVTVAKEAVNPEPTDDLTATYTFVPTMERIEVTGEPVEGREDGTVLEVNLIASDTEVCYFKEDQLEGNVTMYGQPPGVSLDWVEYVDEDTIKIHLAGNATVDYDTNRTATIRVKQAALEWNNSDLTGTFTFRAIDEDEEYGDLYTYRNGFSSSYKYVLTGKNAEAGFAAIRLPEDPDVPRYADEVVVNISLPDGVQYMAKAGDTTTARNYYVKVYGRSGELPFTLVSSSRSGLEISITGVSQPLDLAVVFKFDVDDKSKLEIDSDYAGDIKATVEYVGFRNGASVFSGSQDLLIARVASGEVTVSAASPKTVAIGSNREAAKITIAEGTAGTLKDATITLEIVTDGVSFNPVTRSKVTGIRYTIPSSAVAITGDDDEILEITMPSSQTIGLPGKVEITPYLDLTPDAGDDIEIQVTVTSSGGKELADETVTVAKVAAAVSYTVTDVKNTGGSIVAGHNATILKEDGDAAELTIKTVGSATFPKDALIYVEISGAKFDSSKPFKVNNTYAKTYNDDKAAWFEPPDDDDDVTLSDFMVKADGEAAVGNIVLKFSSNLGTFDPAEVVIGQVVKPFEVSASAAPELTYLGRAQAAGDIVIKETQKGAIIDGFVVRLPEGVIFTAKPTVKVTEGNLDISSSLASDRELKIKVNSPSTRQSTITISSINYDVNRLALDGDVEVRIVGVDDRNYAGWKDKVLAKVVNAKVVSEAAAPAPTKREASFVIGSTTYKVNGEEKTMDVAPYIDAASGRTYLPVRYVAYALGVSEDNIFYSNGQVSLLKDGRAVQMTIGSKSLVVNGVSITMDAAPVIKDGRTMLPFRWIATALGASVSWDEATKTVTMTIE